MLYSTLISIATTFEFPYNSRAVQRNIVISSLLNIEFIFNCFIKYIAIILFLIASEATLTLNICDIVAV